MLYYAGDSAKLQSYDSSAEGMVQSFRERFPAELDSTIQQLWDKDAPYFPL
jgi:hypothetical protein